MWLRFEKYICTFIDIIYIFLLFQTCYHYGIVTVSDGKCRPQTTRLKLCPDLLVLQREEFIFPDDDDGYPVDNKVSYLHLLFKTNNSI